MKPIVSYGCIAFRVVGEWRQAAEIVGGDTRVIPQIEYLMIQRRDSIGFVEFMRGKYNPTDTDYVRCQLEGMTREEQRRLVETPFDDLWSELWGLPQEGFHAYRNEKEQARQKLEELRSNRPSLQSLIDAIPVIHDTPEWGFPKGRRDSYESEYACAMREFKEETNLSEKDVYPVRNLDPISEVFTGTNSVQYCHKYFMVYVPPAVAHGVAMVPESVNKDMAREVGDIRWFSLEGALERIRPLHVEKRNVLLRADAVLKRMMPILLGCAPV
jgi:8-oxo-dGTP pyrophosphatase MutT (NUDIX family)